MIFTYHLRENVPFHCGHILTAADAVFSFERALTAAPMNAVVWAVENVEAIDDLTVQITLNDIDPMFHLNGNIAIMCHICGADVQPGFYYPNIGTGSYMVTDWGAGRRVVMDRFEDWHYQHVRGSLPQIERQIRYVVADQTTMRIAFEAGDIDYLGVPAVDWDHIVNTGNFTTFTQQSWHTTYLVFNQMREPFDDVRIRQAINYAINPADVMLAAIDGRGDVAYMLGNPYYITHLSDLTTDPAFNRYDFNPERARELLAEAGFPDGLVLEYPLGTPPGGHLQTAVEVIQQQLAEVGITVSIEVGDNATYWQDLNLGNFFFAIAGWSWTTSDAFWLQRRFSTGGIGDVNSAHYSNPEVDEYFTIASTTMNQEVRREAFRNAMTIVSQDAVIVPLYYQFALIAWHPNLQANPNRPVFEWYWIE
jgi:peptide/nickel transport system substrate-binding protein